MDLFFLLFSSIHLGSEYTFLQWGVGLILFSFLLFPYLKKKTSFLTALLFTYWLIWVIHIIYIRTFNYYSPYTIDRDRLCLFALMETFCVLMLTISFCLLGIKKLVTIYLWLPAYAVINSLYVIAGWAFGFGTPPSGYGSSGFIQNPGLNGCLIALCILPAFSIKKNLKKQILSIVPCLVAIILSKSSMPYGVLLSGLVPLILLNLKWYSYPLIATVVGSTLAIGSLLDPHLFSSSNRFQAYSVFMGEWWKIGKIWFGLGPGSYAAFQESIQMKYKFMYDSSIGILYAWKALHSDWLEVGLFQLGIIGMGLLIAVYFEALYRFRKEKHLFSLLCAYGFFALFDYPKNHFMTASLGFLLLFLAHGLVVKNDVNTKP